MTLKNLPNSNLDYQDVSIEYKDCSGDFQDIGSEYEQVLSFIKHLTKFGINPGLKRIKALLCRLGSPEKNLRVIHIGGTNGKGSTAAILQSVLREAGYKAGLFTSPHLHDYRERITINGKKISREDVIDCMREIRLHVEDLLSEGVEHPTEFEISTALAILYFARRKPDFVLLEVGLGGEIDSTNVVKPLITVLTSIGMDHMDYLGDTLEKITSIKTGIIKEGVPLVTSASKPEALQVIKEYAALKNSRVIIVGRDVRWKRGGIKENCFTYCGLNTVYQDLKLSLLGEHQFVNASAVLAVCEILQEQNDAGISEEAVRRGLSTVVWPGRLELISGNPKILLDGAHNADGMESLAKALRQYAKDQLQRERLVLCLGMLGDKETEKAVNIIGPLADGIVVTKPDSPRAGDWTYLARIAMLHVNPERVHLIEDPVKAVQKCLKMLKPGDMLCITGSLYLLAPIRQYLLDYCGQLPKF